MVRLLSNMKCRQCSILVQLCLGHVGLQSYLACFAHTDSPICEHCTTLETVEQYLTACKQHTRERSALIRNHENTEIRNKSKDVATLVSHPDAIPITLRYIADTGRFLLHTPINLTQAFKPPIHPVKTSLYADIRPILALCIPLFSHCYFLFLLSTTITSIFTTLSIFLLSQYIHTPQPTSPPLVTQAKHHPNQ